MLAKHRASCKTHSSNLVANITNLFQVTTLVSGATETQSKVYEKPLQSAHSYKTQTCVPRYFMSHVFRVQQVARLLIKAHKEGVGTLPTG